MPTGAISIHGGSGSEAINFAFTVTGTNTLRYAQQFASNVNALIAPGGENPTYLTPDGASAKALPGTESTPFYVLTAVPSDPVLAYTIATSGYVLDSIGGANTVNGAAAGGDTILAAAVNIAATVNTSGADNLVIFVDGNNTYNGAGSTGGDTVVGGTGFDTVNTGTAATTVFGGAGSTTIYLNDTSTPDTGTVNDIAYLDDGKATVYAAGVNDQVWATTPGQTIIGDAASGTLGVVLGAFGGDGANLVSVTGGAETTVFNNTGNDTIDAGTGTLNVYDAQGVVTFVNIGSGSTYVFGNASTDVVLGSVGSSGSGVFIAAGGNETLSGGTASANLLLFGSTVTGAVDSLSGGTGSDTLVAGVGADTLDGGTGSNEFLIAASQTDGSNITIGDFWASSTNTLALSGFTSQDVTNILTKGTVENGSYVVTLSNGGTLTFEGITSGSSLSGHIVQF